MSTDTTGTYTLAELNALGVDDFTAALGALFEHSPWVARDAWSARRFQTSGQLRDALEAAMRAAPPDRRLALIRAHPELAGRAARVGELTAASSREQASAGLHRLSPQDAERLRALNRAYGERFGFPLIVCVREHTLASLLEWGEERLERSREQELDTALGEIAKIAGIRLAELLR
jgi:OHCU decarboxylase